MFFACVLALVAGELVTFWKQQQEKILVTSKSNIEQKKLIMEQFDSLTKKQGKTKPEQNKQDP